jgi:DNA invertase Pin-like site-specific DNA recombinase
VQTQRIVAYHRVSTQKQARSDLGLSAQQDALARFATANGLKITGTFTEVETGKGADALDQRPQLAAALASSRPASCAPSGDQWLCMRSSTTASGSSLGRTTSASTVSLAMTSSTAFP